MTEVDELKFCEGCLLIPIHGALFVRVKQVGPAQGDCCLLAVSAWARVVVAGVE